MHSDRDEPSARRHNTLAICVDRAVNGGLPALVTSSVRDRNPQLLSVVTVAATSASGHAFGFPELLFLFAGRQHVGSSAKADNAITPSLRYYAKRFLSSQSSLGPALIALDATLRWRRAKE